MAIGTQELLAQKRQVDPQLDMRNLLTAMAGAMSAPHTGYAGLTADQVARSAGNTMDALSKQAALLQAAQSGAVQQEQAQFNDAMKSHQMNMEAQRLDLARASHALQQMAQQAAMERAAREEARQTALYNSMRDKNVRLADGTEVNLEELAALGSLGTQMYKTANTPVREVRPTNYDKQMEQAALEWGNLGASPELVEVFGRRTPEDFRKGWDKFWGDRVKADPLKGAGLTPEEQASAQLQYMNIFAPNASISDANVLRGLLGMRLLSERSWLGEYLGRLQGSQVTPMASHTPVQVPAQQEPVKLTADDLAAMAAQLAPLMQ